MEWADYQKQRSATIDLSKWQITEIRCPKCGDLIYRDKTIVLTTYPAQYRYECHSCGWSDTGY